MGGGFAPTGREKTYSATQMIQALQSTMAQVKEQLGVLSILDGTAATWPGINQAISDMEFIIDMSTQTTTRLEGDAASQRERGDALQEEVAALRVQLAESHSAHDQLQKESNEIVKDNRQLTKSLEGAQSEVASQREEIWQLEQTRSQLAKEGDKLRSDVEGLEAETSELKTNVSEQQTQISDLREELAAHRSDVQHYQRENADLKGTVSELRRQLDATTSSLRKTQATLEHMRTDKEAAEREADRLDKELKKTAAELTKVSAEFLRQKEWTLVVKKVEADKLKEAESEHNKAAIAWEQAKNELEQAIVRLEATTKSAEAIAAAKTHDASQAAKQLNLLQIQARDQQKTMSVHQADKAAMARELEGLKAKVAELTAKLQAATLAAAKMDKEKALAQAKQREQANVDRAKLASAFDEARKEGAVQKALADGWARDLKQVQAQLRAEQRERAEQQRVMEELLRDDAGKAEKMETVRRVASLEQIVRDLKGQLSAKDTEGRRVRAEAASTQKQLEAHVRALQRECNEGAIELQRMRQGESLRLPPLGRPVMLTDELDDLKRVVDHTVAVKMAGQAVSSPSRIAALPGGKSAAPRMQQRAASSGPPPGMLPKAHGPPHTKVCRPVTGS
uniref:Uncharacterized protein n=1 Tax=Chlamydomonas euryale TaxID=1486919 RepID=A0A7R9VNG0_9CHLO|mmetsp:Transcript_39182/g.116553  ORF Transcript_39182/g.116553 Transcript_39182/m.116553 type:complete len:624 (+) Transcript_39182:680-2551(+)